MTTMTKAREMRNAEWREWLADQIDPDDVASLTAFVSDVLLPTARAHQMRFWSGNSPTGQVRNATGSLRKFLDGGTIRNWCLDLLARVQADRDWAAQPQAEESEDAVLAALLRIEAVLHEIKDQYEQ